ncbi:MAG: dienelactone hydrolase family protein [Saprospiraceae bacterium]
MKSTILCLLACLSCLQMSLAQSKVYEDLSLKYVVRKPTKLDAKTPTLILMHGYGSNEGDLFGLETQLPKNFLVISVRAPYSLGGNSFEWFSLPESGSTIKESEADLQKSVALVKKFVAEVLAKFKTDPKQVYLSGFSQGGMMAYSVGLTAPEMFKGIAPLGGRIFEVTKKEIKVSTPLKQLRIFIGHGDQDNRVAYKYATDAEKYLKSLGLSPELHTYKGLGHSINAQEVMEVKKWLESN